MKYINITESGIAYRNMIPKERSIYLHQIITDLFSTSSTLGSLIKNSTEDDTKKYCMNLILSAQYYHNLLLEHFAYENTEVHHIHLTLKAGEELLNHMEMSIQYLEFKNHQIKMF